MMHIFNHFIKRLILYKDAETWNIVPGSVLRDKNKSWSQLFWFSSIMATRSERDKQKVLQDRHQMILSALLKDEDNKYCVDCDAKGLTKPSSRKIFQTLACIYAQLCLISSIIGPRWASWNLGIFLCIRCAGIHRNLGVHISKVKSVNLDSWTSEQVAVGIFFAICMCHYLHLNMI